MRENKKLLALQYLLQYLVMRGIEKAGQLLNYPAFFYISIVDIGIMRIISPFLALMPTESCL